MPGQSKLVGLPMVAGLLLGSLGLVAQAENNASPAAKAKVRIVLVGDSTVTDEAGWGLGFKEGLRPDAECINESSSGRSSKSYRAEGKWDKALARKPDYILIQFGHNDQPGKGPARETDPNSTYRENMARYVDEARAAGAKPILVTPIARRHFDKDGVARAEPVQALYSEAVRRVAKEKKVPLVDLQALTLELYTKLGAKGCRELSPINEGVVDDTHLNAKGGRIVGWIAIEEVRKAVPELAPYLKKAERQEP